MVAATYPGTVSPLRGLDPFGEAERDVWAGREQERDDIAKMVIADGFRAGLVYGEPGVGKTSLVRAGLIPHLRDHGIVALACDDLAQPAASFASGLSSFGIQPTAGEAPAAFITRAVANAVAGQLFVFVIDDADLLCADERAANELAEVFAKVVSRSGGRARFLFVAASERMHALGALERRTGSLFPPSTRYELTRLAQGSASAILDRVLSLSGVAADPALAEAVVQGISRGQPLLAADLQIAAMAMRAQKISSLAALQDAGGPSELESVWLHDACRATGNERSALRMCAELATSPAARARVEVARRINLEPDFARGRVRSTLEGRGVVVRADPAGATWMLRHEVLAPRIRELTAPARAAARRAFDLLGSKTATKERLSLTELRALKSEGIAPITVEEIAVVDRSKRRYMMIAGGIAALPVIAIIALYVAMHGRVFFALAPRPGGEHVVVESGRSGLSRFAWLPGIGYGHEVADTGLSRAMVAPEVWKKIEDRDLGATRDWSDLVPDADGAAPGVARRLRDDRQRHHARRADQGSQGSGGPRRAARRAAPDRARHGGRDRADRVGAQVAATGGAARRGRRRRRRRAASRRLPGPARRGADLDRRRAPPDRVRVGAQPRRSRARAVQRRARQEPGRDRHARAARRGVDRVRGRGAVAGRGGGRCCSTPRPRRRSRIAPVSSSPRHSPSSPTRPPRRSPICSATATRPPRRGCSPPARCTTPTRCRRSPRWRRRRVPRSQAKSAARCATAALPLYARVDPATAADDLTKMLDKKGLDKPAREAAALAWGELAAASKDATNKDATQNALERMLKDDDADIRAAAATAAGKLGRVEQELLIKLAKQESYNVRIAAAEGLAATALTGGNPSYAVDGIAQLWAEKGALRRAAAKTYAKLAKKKPALVDLYLNAAAHSPDDPGLHAIGAEGLCNATLAGSSEARKMLRGAIDGTGVDLDVRRIVMRCVGDGPEPAKNGAYIAQKLANDVDTEVRVGAARVLALVAAAKAGKPIGDLLVKLLDDPDREVRIIAIRAVGSLGDDAPKPATWRRWRACSSTATRARSSRRCAPPRTSAPRRISSGSRSATPHRSCASPRSTPRSARLEARPCCPPRSPTPTRKFVVRRSPSSVSRTSPRRSRSTRATAYSPSPRATATPSLCAARADDDRPRHR